MLKLAKRFTAMATAMTLALGLSVNAMANETAASTTPSTIKVQLNGENIAFGTAAPTIKKGSTYVPFRSVFEAMGATVAYDEATKTVKATKEDTTIAFQVGSTDVSVTQGEKTSTVKTETASFEEAGSTYVPVRFVGQTLGYQVGWDSYDKTVILVDKDALLESYTGKFTIMNKMMESQKKLFDKNLKVKGSFTVDVSVLADPSSKDPVVVKAVGDIGGITNQDVVNMNVAMKVDLSSVKKMLADNIPQEAQVEANKMMAALENVKIDVIFDSASGKYYLSSPLFEQAGMDGTAWYYVDINEMFDEMGGMPASMNFTSLMQLSKTGNFETLLKMIPETVPFDSTSDYADCKEALDMFVKLFGDDAFKKENNTYVSTFTEEADGMKIEMKMTLIEKNNAINDCTVAMKMSAEGSEIMSMEATNTGLDSTVKMKLGVPEIFTMVLDMKMNYSETSSAPLTKPAPGSKVIKLPL